MSTLFVLLLAQLPAVLAPLEVGDRANAVQNELSRLQGRRTVRHADGGQYHGMDVLRVEESQMHVDMPDFGDDGVRLRTSTTSRPSSGGRSE